MKITSFRGKTAMLSTEIMEKNEQLRNVRPRRGTVPRPIIAHRTVPCDTLQIFKDMNDWGKPMDWERASFRPKKASFDLYMIPSRTLSSDAVASAFFAETGTKLKDVGNSFLLDISPSGQELHCVKTDSFGAEKAILFIVSENMECTFVTTTCLEIDRAAIENLKKQAKWQHGNN